MLRKIANWLAGSPKQELSAQQNFATIALFFIFANCSNALPPNFTFDGTAESGADGSFFNQIFWILILIISIAIAIKPPKIINQIYFKALPLLAFCALMIFSSAWSLSPEITLRRAILESIIIFSILIGISSLQHPKQIFTILYRVFSVILLFELFMLLRANGFDEEGLFRGIHPQKNVLGLVGAISILIGFWVRQHGNIHKKTWNAIYLISWVALLVLSRSKTSLALTIVAPFFALASLKMARHSQIGIGTFITILISFAYSIFSLFFIAGFDIGSEIEKIIHHIGFTGRDGIWEFLIARFLENPWIGHGYGGFWDIGPDSPNIRYGTGFIPMINQAHNGYLDLLLALGLLGFLFYMFVFFGFLRCLGKSTHNQDQSIVTVCWTLMIFSLLHNFTETSLIRGSALAWIIQVVSMAVIYRVANNVRD